MWFRRKVQLGKQLGRVIGFPTINLRVGSFASHYDAGVYACEVEFAGQYYVGALHFGPALHESKNKLEIHLLNFNQDIYKKWVKFRVIKKIREPRRFMDLNDLKKQIQIDVKALPSTIR